MQTVSSERISRPIGSSGRWELKSYLSMYAEQPTRELTLQDFEVYAIDRLKLLKKIEQLKTRGATFDEMKKEIKEISKLTLGGDISGLTQVDEEVIRKDEMSHHILRLAYCHTEDQRRWFLTQETALFRTRLESYGPTELRSFMKCHGLVFDLVSQAEKTELKDLFQRWRLYDRNMGEIQEEKHEQYFKVYFTQALELVSSRKVLLHNGYAYVPDEKLKSIIVGRFRSHLSQSLVLAYKWLYNLPPDDERLQPLLLNLSKAYTGPSYNAQHLSVGNVSAEDVNTLAQSSFPLCMRHLHTSLKSHHHLRHSGRMQYGLFLKGIGLNLEEAMKFWQKEFSSKVSPEDFIKRYAYNIRHNYGKEGKRADYTPYSCQKIIHLPAPGKNEFHGCPYRHWNERALADQLSRMNLSASSVENILSSVRTKDFQLACRKEFEARHPQAIPEDVGNHPNSYFKEAQQAIKLEQEKRTEAAATTNGTEMTVLSTDTTQAKRTRIE